MKRFSEWDKHTKGGVGCLIILIILSFVVFLSIVDMVVGGN